MGGGIMKLEVIQLLKHDDKVVMYGLQLPPVPAGSRLLGFHTTPQLCTQYIQECRIDKMTKWTWRNS